MMRVMACPTHSKTYLWRTPNPSTVKLVLRGQSVIRPTSDFLPYFEAGENIYCIQYVARVRQVLLYLHFYFEILVSEVRTD